MFEPDKIFFQKNELTGAVKWFYAGQAGIVVGPFTDKKKAMKALEDFTKTQTEAKTKLNHPP